LRIQAPKVTFRLFNSSTTLETYSRLKRVTQPERERERERERL